MLKKITFIALFLYNISFAAAFTSGTDYQIINGSKNTKNEGVVVEEFFSYGCPWCFKIENSLNQWLKQSDKKITFERIPVVFKPSWELYAKAYYTAKVLALSDKLSPLLFKSIQEENKSLDTAAQMTQFFIQHGVDPEIAKSAFNSSPSIEMKVQSGMILMSNYQINAVPAFVVNHHFKTDLQMAGNPERLIEILDWLVKQ